LFYKNFRNYYTGRARNTLRFVAGTERRSRAGSLSCAASEAGWGPPVIPSQRTPGIRFLYRIHDTADKPASFFVRGFTHYIFSRIVHHIDTIVHNHQIPACDRPMIRRFQTRKSA
jgi:hypothetical protein